MRRVGLRIKLAVGVVLCATLPVVVHTLTINAAGVDPLAVLFTPDLAAAYVLILVVGAVWAQIMVQPIEHVTAAMQRLAAGERNVTLPVNGKRDEVGEMAAAFNRMSWAITEGEARLRDFAQTASVWFWETDETLRFTRWGEDQRPGDCDFLTDLGRSGAHDAAAERLRADIEARRPFHDFRFSFIDGRGARRHYRASGMPVVDATGAFRGYRGVGADETASMEARARAEKAEAVLMESIENISEGFALYDENDCLVLCNSKYRDIAVEHAGRRPSSTNGHIEQQLPDGRWVLMREWRTRSGGTIGILTDISELKRREEELRIAKEHAELANRAKSEFLANMSHELRTPLNAIIGFSELMKSEVFGALGDERYKAYATDICDSGVHLLQIINDILDLSKIEAARFELHDEALHLPDTARAAIRIINQRAADAGVEIITDIDRDLPALLADQRCVKQILLNLLSNAVKFTLAGGTITVRAKIAEDGAMHLEVADTGIGISERDLPKALASFSQVDSALTRKYQGTGLGLPLTMKLVELHGGCLRIESKVNVGTRVTAVFPKERVLPLPAALRLDGAGTPREPQAAVA
ncbi:MAG: HAMP domain-containing protein [Rhodospirillaceae bacterium]|nr:HAMP domain-containing protein [Rhodospirillaceae bacterium]